MKLKHAKPGSTVTILGEPYRLERLSACAATVQPLEPESVEVKGRRFKRKRQPLIVARNTEIG